jgi:hypothetical protein
MPLGGRGSCRMGTGKQVTGEKGEREVHNVSGSVLLSSSPGKSCYFVIKIECS